MIGPGWLFQPLGSRWHYFYEREEKMQMGVAHTVFCPCPSVVFGFHWGWSLGPALGDWLAGSTEQAGVCPLLLVVLLGDRLGMPVSWP